MSESRAAEERDFNVFCGADIGVFKGININNKCCLSKNFEKLSSLTKESAITCLSYGEDESEILVGTRGQMVKVFDVADKCYTAQKDVSGGSGPLVGVARYKEALISASESGEVNFWAFGAEKSFNPINSEVYSMGKLGSVERSEELTQEQKDKHAESLKIGRKLCRLRQCGEARNLVAVGGKEVDLQVWDIDSIQEPIFKAKNVRPDFLELRVPVWISDVTFLSKDSVATCSRYGHIRKYDIRGVQRRPSSDLIWQEKDEDLTCTAICTVNENQVLVGTSTGKLALWDFTPNAGYRGLIRKYKGCVGAVKSIFYVRSKEYFGVVGLDRYLRIFSIKEVKPVHNMYLKSKMTSLLLSSTFDLEDPSPQEISETQKQEEAEADVDKDDEDIEIIEDEDMLDQAVEEMSVSVADTKLENVLSLPDYVYKDKNHTFYEFFSTSKKARKILKSTDCEIEREKALNKIRQQFENFKTAHNVGHLGPAASKKRKMET